MDTHFSLTDTAFERQFEDATLDPALFNHEAHLRLAWIHINNYGTDAAIVNITQQLQNYVAKLGAQDKYNHTLTIAAIKAVQHFYNKTTADSFADFISQNTKLKDNFRDLLGSHYSTNIFTSEEAKSRFLEPELLPFD